MEAATARVDPSDSLKCDQYDSIEQLYEALKSCPRGKRPGPDGLPYEFYQAFWPLLGSHLKAAMDEALGDEAANDYLPESMRKCLITLIYKKGGKDPADPASYRPISLLNCDYKIIAKSLGLQMANALKDVIPSTQTAFLPDRWIGDNVEYHLQLIDFCEGWGKKQAEDNGTAAPSAALFFLDFEKAYDRVNREWMTKCVQHLGFSNKIVRAVKVLLSNTSAQVVLNGFKTSSFQLQRGVHQGSPLSTLLYILQLYPMTAYIERLAAQRIIEPIMLPNDVPAPICNHHADDTTLGVKTIEDGITAFEQGVQRYCRASGARSSLSKAAGMTLGSHPHVEGLEPRTGARFIGPQDSHKHLGIPLARPGAAQDQAVQSMFIKVLRNMRYSAR